MKVRVKVMVWVRDSVIILCAVLITHRQVRSLLEFPTLTTLLWSCARE